MKKQLNGGLYLERCTPVKYNLWVEILRGVLLRNCSFCFLTGNV
jgi:hypothetical protein